MRLPFLFLTFFLLTDIYGQTNSGLKAGLNWSNVKDNLNQTTTKAGADLYGGGYADIGIASNLFIRTELLYSHKGSVVYGSVKGRERLHYITLPVLLGFRATSHLKVFMGPEIGYLLSAKSKVSNTQFDITKNNERLDKAIDIGVAYQANRRWGAEIRYSHGFETSRYFVYPDGRKDEVYKTANRVVQAGLYFSLSK